MFWIIPLACALIAAGCAAAGALAVLPASRAVTAHAERLNATTLVDPERLKRARAKFSAVGAAARAERERLNAAIVAVVAAVQDLRLPEAVMALRLTGVAVRSVAAVLGWR